MNLNYERGMCMQQIYFRLQESMERRTGVRRNVEIKTVYGLAVPIICGFSKTDDLLPEREYNKEELKRLYASMS